MDIVSAISLVVGIIGTGIAIYQWAVINEGKKRKHELQYLLAGINASANQKTQAWQNQLSIMPRPSSPEELRLIQLYIRARDDLGDIANLTSALEGTIETENSAIVNMMDKYKKIVEKNEAIRRIGQPDPKAEIIKKD
jgi:hypothetical protein